MGRQRQRTDVENERSRTFRREDLIDLDGFERLTASKHLYEPRLQCGALKSAVAELIERDSLGLIARDPEHRIEGAVGRLDPLVNAQHDERIGDRVEDRLGGFAFENGLLEAGAESRHIGERQNDARDLAIAVCARRYSNHEPRVPDAEIGPGFHSVGDDPAALLFQLMQASKRPGVAARSTHVQRRQAEHVGRSRVEESNPQVGSHEDDGNLHGAEDMEQIGRSHVCRLAVAFGLLEIGPGVVERNVLHSHQADPVATYSVRLRCSTGSASIGRT